MAWQRDEDTDLGTEVASVRPDALARLPSLARGTVRRPPGGTQLLLAAASHCCIMRCVEVPDAPPVTNFATR